MLLQISAWTFSAQRSDAPQSTWTHPCRNGDIVIPPQINPLRSSRNYPQHECDRACNLSDADGNVDMRLLALHFARLGELRKFVGLVSPVWTWRTPRIAYMVGRAEL